MFPSLTSILSVLFLVYVAHSIWTLVAIFRVPTCQHKSSCYESFLNDEPSLDLFVYTTTGPNNLDGTPIFSALNFDYREPFEREVSIDIPQSTRKNGSLFVHAFVVPTKPSSSSSSKKLSPTLHQLINTRNHAYLKRRLTKYALPRDQAFNLLRDNISTGSSSRPVTHLKGRFVLLMCVDRLSVSERDVPMELAGLMRLNADHKILPIVRQDFMQTRQRDLIEVGPSSGRMNFTLGYAPTSFGKLRFLIQIEYTLTNFLKLGFTEKDLDEIKGVFADTNLFLLCATMFIGSVHLLFDFLSFKNDVSFWRSNSSMAGLSTRTVLWRAFSQTVVFMFLLDEGTSLLVLIPSGIATLIEFWKVKKVLKASVSWQSGLPRIRLDKDNRETAEEAQTRRYDEECMRYLSYVLYPLCVGSAVYSLVYQPHKSWYSWTINSLVNGVYAFGFLFMLPQLFVNYRLKSVAALPWRAFMYRAFNTFIDDIFAFIITMPTAHRVACFRDDIIFIIYLYQRWLYPVDKMRTEDIDEGSDLTIKSNSKKND